MYKPLYLIIGLFVCTESIFPICAQAQNAPKISITTIVTTLGPKSTAPPTIAKEDVIVFSGKTRLVVTDWVPAEEEKGGLQLAIVIDNSANQFRTGTQLLNDVADLITQQAKEIEVGVFYAFGGTVKVASPFSKDRNAAVDALRAPLALGAANSPSVFNSLEDLIGHSWQPTGAAREILLISSGADGMNRGPNSPYVQAAINNIQIAGVVVHSVFFNGGGFDQSMGSEIGEGNLRELTEESGGYNLFDGISMPSSYASYLKQLDTALHHQYRLTFTMDPSNKAKGELREIKIRTELHHVDLKYPKQVFVSGTAQ